MSAENLIRQSRRPTIVETTTILAIVVVLGGLLIPSVSSRCVYRSIEYQRLSNIAKAIRTYEATYHILPPAYTVDADGHKLHSWRTLLLPYLGEAALYGRIDLTKSWNAPENAVARATEVQAFKTPGVDLPSGQTLYRVIVDPSGIFTGSKQTQPASVTDSEAYTLSVIQVAKNQTTHWMAPEEYSVQDFMNIQNLEASGPNGSTRIADLSGGVGVVHAQNVTKEQIMGLVTKDGGEQALHEIER